VDLTKIEYGCWIGSSGEVVVSAVIYVWVLVKCVGFIERMFACQLLKLDPAAA
jgi:hypothetical protein